MTEQEAFLKQAASDYKVFQWLLEADRAEIRSCHPLHYLQMSTEKLAKATMIAVGQPLEKMTHVAFSHLPYVLRRSGMAPGLGWRVGMALRHFLRKASPIFREIDELNPSVGTRKYASADGGQPNVEYPWRSRDQDKKFDWHAPADHPWPLIERLRQREGYKVLEFIEMLIERIGVIRP